MDSSSYPRRHRAGVEDVKTAFDFTIQIGIDAEKLVESESYKAALLASAEEFANELKEFIDKHPFTIGCSVVKSDLIKQ